MNDDLVNGLVIQMGHLKTQRGALRKYGPNPTGGYHTNATANGAMGLADCTANSTQRSRKKQEDETMALVVCENMKKAVVQLKKATGWDTPQAAKKTGISKTTLHTWENNGDVPLHIQDKKLDALREAYRKATGKAIRIKTL